MAALNSKETEQLRNAQAMIQYILRNGYDPAKVAEKDPQSTYTKVQLDKTNKELNTIVQMKGYFPS